MNAGARAEDLARVCARLRGVLRARRLLGEHGWRYRLAEWLGLEDEPDDVTK